MASSEQPQDRMSDGTAPRPAPADVISAEWAAIVGALNPIASRLSGKLVDTLDPQLRQEYYQAILSQVVGGYLGLLSPHPRYPDFWPYTTTGLTATLNNPDANYYLTPVDDDGVYLLSGFRGSVHKMDVQTGGGRWLTRGAVDDMEQAVARSYDMDEDVKIEPDGSFEVILSRSRPDGHTGNWWQLAAGTTFVMARDVSYDWYNEVDGRLAIDRLDVSPLRPRRTAGELATDLAQIAIWAENNVSATLDFAQLARNQGINRLANLILDIESTGFFGKPNQFYAYGGFELGPDEALLIECPVPEPVRYWNIQLGDDLGFTPDWMNRQTSLNGFQAVVDDDRVFRVVISTRDPQVPNWLDTMGYRSGTLCARWEGCAAPPAGYEATRLPISELRDRLPEDTPVVTGAAREHILRQRRRGVQLRKRW
jgi:hypothetical protein